MADVLTPMASYVPHPNVPEGCLLPVPRLWTRFGALVCLAPLGPSSSFPSPPFLPFPCVGFLHLFVSLSLSLFLWCEFRGGFVPLLVVTACRLHGLARKPAGGSNTKAFCALAGRSRLTSPTRLPPSFLACKLAKNNPEVARCRKNLCNSRLRQDFVSAAELRVFLHTASCMLRLRIPDARARARTPSPSTACPNCRVRSASAAPKKPERTLQLMTVLRARISWSVRSVFGVRHGMHGS